MARRVRVARRGKSDQKCARQPGPEVEIYTSHAARAAPASRSAAPMHASAALTWERTISWRKRMHCQLGKSIFQPKRALDRPERTLCRIERAIFGFKRALFQPKEFCVALNGPCNDLKRALLGRQSVPSGHKALCLPTMAPVFLVLAREATCEPEGVLCRSERTLFR